MLTQGWNGTVPHCSPRTTAPVVGSGAARASWCLAGVVGEGEDQAGRLGAVFRLTHPCWGRTVALALLLLSTASRRFDVDVTDEYKCLNLFEVQINTIQRLNVVSALV